MPNCFDPASHTMKIGLLSFVAVYVVVVAPAFAGAQSCPLSLASLKKMSECELTHLFESASPGDIPTGYGRGHVLRMTDAKLPRVQARLFGLAWKGKHFETDGDFINQFPGFKALRGKVELGEIGRAHV